MKKLFLLFTMTACLASTQAEVSNVWTDQSLELPRATTEAGGKDMIAIAADKSVYTTGLFTQPFSFGTTDLEPIATSTYLTKYDAAGDKKWAVAFAGAATPTAITVAEDGSVYVAGTLADEVIFGSTDGVTVKKEGVKKPDGKFYANQCVAFIAQYDADGVLKNVMTYAPEALAPDVYPANYEGDDPVIIKITSLQKTADKLFASIIIRGKYAANGIEIKGTYFGIPGIFFGDVDGGCLVSFDNNLQMTTVYASLKAVEALENNYDIANIKLAVENNQLFATFTTKGGSLVLTAGDEDNSIVYSSTVVGVETFDSKGYVVTKTNISTSALDTYKVYEALPADYRNYNNNINAVNVVNSDLVLTGNFQKDLAFDNSIIATDDADLYVTVLDAADLSVKSVATSAQAGKEIARGTAIIGDNVFVSGLVNKSSILYSFNLSDKTTSVLAVDGYLNGIAANGEDMASVNALVEGETAKLVVKLDKYSFGQGIGNSTSNEPRVTVYPNPVANELFLSEASDVEIYSIAGSLVLSKKNATSIHVESLASGSYIAVISTANGKQTTHLIKK